MPVPPDAAKRRFGNDMRRFRERAGFSQNRLAKTIPMSQSMISGIELGDKSPSRDFIVRIDEVLNAEGMLLHRWDNIRRSDGFPPWFQNIAVLEQQATEVRQYHPLLVPGLLQTAEYAEALIRIGRPTDSDEEIKSQVKARIDRQEILTNDHPPWYMVVLDEAWLRRPTGGADVMRAQIDRLVKASLLPRVTLQVIPLRTTHHPGHDGAFKLITAPGKGQIAYTETRASGYPLDDPDVVDNYTKVFGDLRGVALPPDASRDLLTTISGEFR